MEKNTKTHDAPLVEILRRPPAANVVVYHRAGLSSPAHNIIVEPTYCAYCGDSDPRGRPESLTRVVIVNYTRTRCG